jgi:hypothetical protein
LTLGRQLRMHEYWFFTVMALSRKSIKYRLWLDYHNSMIILYLDPQNQLDLLHNCLTQRNKCLDIKEVWAAAMLKLSSNMCLHQYLVFQKHSSSKLRCSILMYLQQSPCYKFQLLLSPHIHNLSFFLHLN